MEVISHTDGYQKYPNYSRPLGECGCQYYSFLRSEARASLNNQCDVRFVKFADTFEKTDSRRCLARVNPLRIVNIVISVSYNNEIISKKSLGYSP